VNGKVRLILRCVNNAAESESSSAHSVGVNLVCGREGDQRIDSEGHGDISLVIEGRKGDLITWKL